MLGVVPRLFHFPQLAEFGDLALFILPYLLAMVMFSISLSALAHQRESIILIIVFTSVPMLFLSGVSWPASAMPWYWKTLGAVIPCHTSHSTDCAVFLRWAPVFRMWRANGATFGA